MYASSLIFVVLFVISRGVSSSSVPLPKGAYDLLSAVNIQSFPYGVTETVGICTNRPPYVTDSNGYPVGKPDVAYRLNEEAQLSVTTSQVFPDGFPADFSVLATIRPDDQNSAFLFTIYNGQNGNEELAIQVGLWSSTDYVHILISNTIVAKQVYISIPPKKDIFRWGERRNNIVFQEFRK